jgi:hypothetical protein
MPWDIWQGQFQTLRWYAQWRHQEGYVHTVSDMRVYAVLTRMGSSNSICYNPICRIHNANSVATSGWGLHNVCVPRFPMAQGSKDKLSRTGAGRMLAVQMPRPSIGRSRHSSSSNPQPRPDEGVLDISLAETPRTSSSGDSHSSRRPDTAWAWPCASLTHTSATG